MAQAAEAKLDSFPCKNLAGLAWALAALRLAPPQSLAPVAEAKLTRFDARSLASRLLGACRERFLSGLTWALAELGVSELQIFRAGRLRWLARC